MPDKQSPFTFCIDLILVGDCYIEWQLSVVCPSDRWKQCLITSVATDEVDSKVFWGWLNGARRRT